MEQPKASGWRGDASMRKRRYGVFGGTFDPVHQAHIQLAVAARRELGLEKVYFVPARRSPLKTESPLSSARHRYRMLLLATKPYRHFVVSTYELRGPSPSFTVRTLAHFQRHDPKAQWYLLMGEDSLSRFTSWRNWKTLLERSIPVVGRRAGKGRRTIPPVIRKRAIFLRKKLPAIAATEIRRVVGKNLSWKRDVPFPVQRYIRKNRLYR